MESGEIIINSYKNFGDNISNENKANNPKRILKKIIIISSIITIIIATLTIFVIFYFLDKKEEKEEPEPIIICESGYFVPEDDPKECIKCSTENCENCNGTKINNTCTKCLPDYMIYNNSICNNEYSFEAIYSIKEKYTIISLLHFIYTKNIKNMNIDSELVMPSNEYNFTTKGYHKILILFDNDLESMGEMFYGINELIQINFTSYFETSKITSFSNMFYSCKYLESIQMPYFNTSNVKKMNGMFQSCSSLVSLNLSNFDTKNVDSMSTMFSGCSSLKALELSNFNTNNLISMSNMFEGCYNLTSINLVNFDTKNVYNLNYLFHKCYSLTSINLSNFDISNVEYMKGMFEDCISITSLDLSNFINNNNTEMSYMFFGCNKLKYIDISGFTSDENISMFHGLPNKGKIIVKENFVGIIKDQIPYDWEYVIKNDNELFFE